MAAPMTAIVEEGRNCWRVAHAGRVAFLIDAAAYFESFAAAIERARHSIFILGWDFNAALRLRRRGTQGARLAELLNSAVERRRNLHVHVLDWDFAMIYALEREILPSYRLAWSTHRRFEFHLDGHHPVGASHHQKIALIDDALAFVGGIDFGARRWDTPEHRAADVRRIDPWGNAYGPFHDVQMAVDGEAARALAELARERWKRATGHRVDLAPPGLDPWPPNLEPELTDADVAIARTAPAFEGRSEVREVEQLYVDALRAARRFVYIENQYLTAAQVGTVLQERLEEEDGPEIVIVNPNHCGGWLEESTMGVLRARLLQRLRAADRQGRLRVYHPYVPGLDGKRFTVHGKVMVVDDAFLRIGSSNLNNRSMGLDTECDLAIESRGEERIETAIAALRNRLLAEHLARPAERVAAALAQTGSLIGAIEALRDDERSLRPLEGKTEEWLDRVVPDSELLDPERPIDAEQLVAQFVPWQFEENRPTRWRLVLMAGAIIVLAVLWRWGPLGEWLDPETLARAATRLRGDSSTPFLVIGVYVIASLLVVPVTALILATGLAFGPLWGTVYALIGVLAGAVVGFGAGRWLGRDAVRRLSGPQLNQINRLLRRRGLLAMVLLRLLPLAPFTIVNMAAGASHLTWMDYVAGTAIGMGPGTALLTLFADRAERFVRSPSLANFAVLTALVVVSVIGMYWLRRQDAAEAG
jgi:phospholipase D1/2